MEVQLLIPSQNQRRILLQVPRYETVKNFRRLVSRAIKKPENTFLLIALGKILLDKNANKELATLSTTYRIRDKTCVFIHINNQSKPSAEKRVKASSVSRKKIVVTTSRSKQKSIVRRRIIRDDNVVSIPFGNEHCDVCQSNTRIKKCKECGCVKCLLKTGDPLICDQCDSYWHLKCAGLTRNPTDQFWYCPECINKDADVVVGKGKAVAQPSKTAVIVRDMDCVLVPVHHVGKIPGIYCGQSWAVRSLVHDWGVHRSKFNVSYSAMTGAVSMVLSKGLKEDKDKGYQFVFSGSGGKLKVSCGRLSVKHMTHDQVLTNHNKAIAITCNAPFDEKRGATAHNWRKSRPIRVCRSSLRAETHPEYAPDEGIRYDGLYKVVKYWPHKVPETGFVIWKFLLRRDDQEYAPWMSSGRRAMSARGIRIIRSNEDLTTKLVRYTIPTRISRMMDSDTKNKRLWKQLREMTFWSEYEFLHYLFDTHVVCSSNACSKPIKNPITTPCGHICCVKCLTQSKNNRCFTCRRALLPADYSKVNLKLTRILQSLNWAYNSEGDMRKMPLPSTEIIAEDKSEGQETQFIKKEFDYGSLNLVAASASSSGVGQRKRKKVEIFIECLSNNETSADIELRRRNKRKRVRFIDI